MLDLLDAINDAAGALLAAPVKLLPVFELALQHASRDIAVDHALSKEMVCFCCSRKHY